MDLYVFPPVQPWLVTSYPLHEGEAAVPPKARFKGKGETLTATSIMRKLIRTALSVTAVAGALVLGSATSASASAFPAPDVSGCLDFSHSSPWGTKQTVYATNTCSVGPFGFRIHNWSRISSETSPCIWVDAHERGGWRWTKGRNHYKIIGC